MTDATQLTLDTTPTGPGAESVRADDRNVPRSIRMRMPHVRQVLADLAETHGVCTRLVPLRRTDTTTGETTVIGVPCGATYASKCAPCAERAKRLRMQQCREGWHLETEPIIAPDPSRADQKELMAYRATLQAAHDDAPPADRAELAAEIEAVHDDLTALGVRGNLPGPNDGDDDGDKQDRRTRSTKRRQDAPDLPFREVSNQTIGQTYTGKDGSTWRPSTFLTVTCGSYGRVKADGTPIDPSTYDYRRAARDAIHFPKLLDRLWQNLRRVAGYDVQYFGAVEPQKRLAPHLHAAIRGTFPRKLVRQVLAATYHQVWWPAYDPAQPIYGDTNRPVWDAETTAYLDPVTGMALRTWDEALADLDNDPDAEPVHVVRFGTVCDIQGVTQGSRSAGKAIGYLTKYLTKSVAECHEPETGAQRAHVDRLADALRFEPCSDRCANWLLYGIQPNHARPGLAPGRCKGKAHKRETLGFAGRRVLVSRKWSGKTLTDHRADRKAHVLRTLGAVGNVSATPPPNQYTWDLVKPADPDLPRREHLLMRAITDRLAWRQQYQAAQLGEPPGSDVSATTTRAIAA